MKTYRKRYEIKRGAGGQKLNPPQTGMERFTPEVRPAGDGGWLGTLPRGCTVGVFDTAEEAADAADGVLLHDGWTEAEMV